MPHHVPIPLSAQELQQLDALLKSSELTQE